MELLDLLVRSTASNSYSFKPAQGRGGYFRSRLDLPTYLDLSLIDWLRQYSDDQSESFIRSFLGRMLFSGDETLKKSSVLSGGEKDRSLLAKMMLKKANVLMLDRPTNHLDLESITAVNRALTVFPGTILFSTHDHEFAQTLATKLMDFSPKGKVKVLEGTYDQYVYGEVK